MSICDRCLRTKAPVGRDIPAAMHGTYCTWECSGYYNHPVPPRRWAEEESTPHPSDPSKPNPEPKP